MKGGFRTRPVVAEARAVERMLYSWARRVGFAFRYAHQDVPAWFVSEWRGAHRHNYDADWARLCPHPPEHRRSGQFDPGWIDCEVCKRPLHFPVEQGAGSLLIGKGWLVPFIPEQPNACTCGPRMPHWSPDDHWRSCPQLWMNDDGSTREEPLPETLPRRPGVYITEVGSG